LKPHAAAVREAAHALLGIVDRERNDVLQLNLIICTTLFTNHGREKKEKVKTKEAIEVIIIRPTVNKFVQSEEKVAPSFLPSNINCSVSVILKYYYYCYYFYYY